MRNGEPTPNLCVGRKKSGVCSDLCVVRDASWYACATIEYFHLTRPSRKPAKRSGVVLITSRFTSATRLALAEDPTGAVIDAVLKEEFLPCTLSKLCMFFSSSRRDLPTATDS